MKILKYIFPLSALMATSAFGAGTVGAAVGGSAGGGVQTAPSQSTPSRTIPGGLNNPNQNNPNQVDPNNPNQNGQQQPGVSPDAGLSGGVTNSSSAPGSPPTGSQNFVTNSLTGQNTNYGTYYYRQHQMTNNMPPR